MYDDYECILAEAILEDANGGDVLDGADEGEGDGDAVQRGALVPANVDLFSVAGRMRRLLDASGSVVFLNCSEQHENLLGNLGDIASYIVTTATAASTSGLEGDCRRTDQFAERIARSSVRQLILVLAGVNCLSPAAVLAPLVRVLKAACQRTCTLYLVVDAIDVFVRLPFTLQRTFSIVPIGSDSAIKGDAFDAFRLHAPIDVISQILQSLSLIPSRSLIAAITACCGQTSGDGRMSLMRLLKLSLLEMSPPWKAAAPAGQEPSSSPREDVLSAAIVRRVEEFWTIARVAQASFGDDLCSIDALPAVLWGDPEPSTDGGSVAGHRTISNAVGIWCERLAVRLSKRPVDYLARCISRIANHLKYLSHSTADGSRKFSRERDDGDGVCARLSRALTDQDVLTDQGRRLDLLCEALRGAAGLCDNFYLTPAVESLILADGSSTRKACSSYL